MWYCLISLLAHSTGPVIPQMLLLQSFINENKDRIGNKCVKLKVKVRVKVKVKVKVKFLSVHIMEA